MDIVQRSVGDVIVLDLAGRITFMQGDVLLRSAIQGLVDRGQAKIVLNLADVSYVDSSGLGELVNAHTAVSQAGGRLKLANISTHLRELLKMTRLLAVFDAFDSSDGAVASFSATPG